MTPDPDLRRDATYNVFWGVKHDDYEFVQRTLDAYARRHMLMGHQEGHLEGFLTGLAIGGVIGVLTTGVLYALF